MAGKEVAKAQETAVGAAFDYGDMSHAGFEDTTINDLSIPFVNVLQTNSPEVEDQTIEGAKAGDLLNSVTKEIMKQPLCVIPVHKEEVWVGWRPRNQGGGVMDRFAPDSEEVKAVIKKNGGSRIPPKGADGKRIPFKGPDGCEMVETYYVYCLILDETGTSVESYCVLAFSSTKIKVQKDWMTAMYTQKGRPPMFANRAKFSTVKQKNNDGSYFNFAVHPFADTWRDSLINPAENIDLLKEAQDFRDMILNGLAKPDFDSVTGSDDGSSGGSSSGGGSGSSDDDEMPF